MVKLVLVRKFSLLWTYKYMAFKIKVVCSECQTNIFFLRSCDISLPCGAIADSMKWEGVFFK